MSLFALLASSTHSVYKYFEHRTLNLVRVPVFLILTLRASLRRAVKRKSLISLICLGCVRVKGSMMGTERKARCGSGQGQGPVGRDGGDAKERRKNSASLPANRDFAKIGLAVARGGARRRAATAGEDARARRTDADDRARGARARPPAASGSRRGPSAGDPAPCTSRDARDAEPNPSCASSPPPGDGRAATTATSDATRGRTAAVDVPSSSSQTELCLLARAEKGRRGSAGALVAATEKTRHHRKDRESAFRVLQL